MILMCPVRSYPRVSVSSTLGCQSVEPFRQSRECGDRLILRRASLEKVDVQADPTTLSGKAVTAG